MGKFIVKDIGTFLIEGDTPTESEAAAMVKVIEDREKSQPVPAIPEPIKPKLPLGEKRVPGPFGIVPTEVRGSIREAVERQGGAIQLLLEQGLSTAGGIAGIAPGLAAAGPPGAVGLSMLTSGLGESISQEIGLSPVSEGNLALALASPGGASIASGGARLAGRSAGATLGIIPSVKVARARVAAKAAGQEITSIGAKILEKGKPASELYETARRLGANITGTGRALPETRKAMRGLIDELTPFKSFPEVKQALTVINNAVKSLSGVTDFNTFIRIRQQIGVAVRRAKSVGVKGGASKKLFAAMSDDLDNLAKLQPTAEAAKAAKAASARAKTEFAVRDLEGIIAKAELAAAKVTGEESKDFSFKRILKAVTDISNQKHPNFDKNFVAGLGDELPTIKKNLRILLGITEAGSPGGPGSLVVRSRFAKGGAIVGAASIGFLIGDVAGAAVGALVGASGPEILTSLLMSKPAMAFLNAAAKAGRGKVSRRSWQIAAQILVSQMRQKTESQAPQTSGGAGESLTLP